MPNPSLLTDFFFSLDKTFVRGSEQNETIVLARLQKLIIIVLRIVQLNYHNFSENHTVERIWPEVNYKVNYQN